MGCVSGKYAHFITFQVLPILLWIQEQEGVVGKSLACYSIMQEVIAILSIRKSFFWLKQSFNCCLLLQHPYLRGEPNYTYRTIPIMIEESMQGQKCLFFSDFGKAWIFPKRNMGFGSRSKIYGYSWWLVAALAVVWWYVYSKVVSGCHAP